LIAAAFFDLTHRNAFPDYACVPCSQPIIARTNHIAKHVDTMRLLLARGATRLDRARIAAMYLRQEGRADQSEEMLTVFLVNIDISSMYVGVLPVGTLTHAQPRSCLTFALRTCGWTWPCAYTHHLRGKPTR
jgi:hypothetical protein